MLKISRSGLDINTVAQQIGNVPKTMIPYAASTAMTRIAKAAAEEVIPSAMRSAFQGVTSWTLNSLRFERATKEKLFARVAVKDIVPPGAVSPENFLKPQVDGGGRKRKRSENSLGYSGVLQSGHYAMPGRGLALDANGNVPGGEMRTILQAVKTIQGEKIKGKRARGVTALSKGLFVGRPNGRKLSGIWRREGEGDGKTLKALFVFTPNAPDFTPRVDFEAQMRTHVEERFRPEFEKAVAALRARGGNWA